MSIDMIAVMAAKQDALGSPVGEIVAVAAAFLYVTTEQLPEPTPDDLDKEPYKTLLSIAELAELLME